MMLAIQYITGLLKKEPHVISMFGSGSGAGVRADSRANISDPRFVDAGRKKKPEEYGCEDGIGQM